MNSLSKVLSRRTLIASLLVVVIIGTVSSRGNPTCHSISESAEKELTQFAKVNGLAGEETINQMRFIAGSCSPVIVLSGFFSSKLMLEINDCQAIKENHTNVYKACFIDRKSVCKVGESQIWLSQNYMTDDGTSCFGELFSLNLQAQNSNSSNEEYQSIPFKGFKVSFYGDTEKSKSKSRCGLSAMEDIVDLPTYLGVKHPRVYSDFNRKLEEMGYVPGLNLFGVPYDWRKLVSDQSTVNLLKKTIDLAFNLNHKKVIIISHSLGGIVSYNYLTTLSQEEKDKKIERMITIGTPFTGSLKMIESLIMGSSKFNKKVGFIFDFINFNLTMKNQKTLANKIPIFYQLIPNYFYEISKGEAWFKLLNERVRIENEITSCINDHINSNPQLMRNLINAVDDDFDDTDFFNFQSFSQSRDNFVNGFNMQLLKTDEDMIYRKCYVGTIEKGDNKSLLKQFSEIYAYPGIDSVCREKGLKNSNCSRITITEEGCIKTFWDERCRIDFMLPSEKQPLIQYQFNGVKKQNNLETKDKLKELLKDLHISEFDEKYFDWVVNSLKPDLSVLNHPGVDVTMFVSTGFETEVSYDFNFNPKDFTKKDIILDEKATKSEFRSYQSGDESVPNFSSFSVFFKWSAQNKKNDLELVDVCTNEKSAITKEKSRYRQISCECNFFDKKCNHSALITDKYLISSITTGYLTNSKADDKILRGITVSELKQLSELKCTNLQ